MPVQSIVLKLISTLLSIVPGAQAPVPYGPSSPPKPPDPWDMFTQRIFDSFGVPGLIALAIIVFLIGVVWWQWDIVQKRPGLSWLIERARRRRLPKFDPRRYGVAVLRLQDDANDLWRTRIIEDLVEFSGVESRALDRCIGLDIHAREDSEMEGHALARAFLQKTGASVAIWGRVIGDGEASRAKLYFTTASNGAEQFHRYGVAEDQRLPELFWNDLVTVLNLTIYTGFVRFHENEGQFVADQLSPFIDRVKQVIGDPSRFTNWSDEQRNSVRLVLGLALTTLGEQSGQNEPLEQAVGAYHAALAEWTRERAPLKWAMTQNNLGLALSTLGERESETTRLEEAIDAYRAAMEEWTRARAPLDWAMAQNNLGIALWILGDREKGTKRLEEAVASYHAALQEITQGCVPLQWAATQNNLGNALRTLGERESGTERLEQAVAAYRAALRERKQERVPLEWAMTQHNLGAALHTIGKREYGTERLKEALAAYRAALRERTQERVPLEWAMTQHNLGNALRTLGEREGGTVRLEEALAAYRAALKERTRERVSLQWANTQNDLGNALSTLGERESGTRHLEEAVAAHHAALDVFNSAGAGHYIEATTANLARAEDLLRLRRGTDQEEGLPSS